VRENGHAGSIGLPETGRASRRNAAFLPLADQGPAATVCALSVAPVARSGHVLRITFHTHGPAQRQLPQTQSRLPFS
jgi:hypothetical protein